MDVIKPRLGPEDLLKEVPCLTLAATVLLEVISYGKQVFEFGAGGSTIWLAERASSLVSVEDDKNWFEAVKAKLTAGVELIHLPTNEMHKALEGRGMYDVIYVDPMEQKARARCITASSTHIKRGGWLVADDYNFPMVKEAVKRLVKGWDIAIVAGSKVHPIRKVIVETSTAFCYKKS